MARLATPCSDCTPEHYCYAHGGPRLPTVLPSLGLPKVALDACYGSEVAEVSWDLDPARITPLGPADVTVELPAPAPPSEGPGEGKVARLRARGGHVMTERPGSMAVVMVPMEYMSDADLADCAEFDAPRREEG